MGDQTTTTENTAGPQSPEAQQLMRLLAQVSGDAQGQMGDLSQIAAGNFQLDPAMQAQILNAQEASGDLARMQMQQNTDQAMRGVENQMLARGMEGSTVEAANQALIGQDMSRQLAQMNMQQQGQSAQQMVNMPFQAAGAQIQGNQALLAQLTGAANPAMNYDAMMRQLGSSSSSTQPFQWGQMAGQIGGQAAGGLTMGLTMPDPA